MPLKGTKEMRGAHICDLEIFLEAFYRPSKQHSKLILVGSRHLQPQENIYIQRNNCQESPNNNLSFLELGPQRPFLVPESILSQNIFLPTTQGPDMKNIFCVTLVVKIYFVKV